MGRKRFRGQPRSQAYPPDFRTASGSGSRSRRYGAAFRLQPCSGPQGACRGTARSRFRSPAPRPHGARGQRRHRMYPSRRAAQRPGHGVPERAQSGWCPPALGRGRAYPLPGRRTGFRLQQIHPRQGGARRRRSVQPVPDAVPDGDAARAPQNYRRERPQVCGLGSDPSFPAAARRAPDQRGSRTGGLARPSGVVGHVAVRRGRARRIARRRAGSPARGHGRMGT